MIGTVPREQWFLLAVTALAIPLSAWGAVYPPNTWLQAGPVAMLLLAAIPLLRRWPLSTASVSGLAGFLLLHLLAARWTYSDVPYVDWAKSLSSIDIDAAFGFERNMFDRLVHFSFGALLIAPAVEIFVQHAGQSRRSAYYSAIMLVLGASAAYEIFEWMLAVAMSPEAAEAYNGQQGDVFDAPKDMASAMLGAAVSSVVLYLRER